MGPGLDQVGPVLDQVGPGSGLVVLAGSDQEDLVGSDQVDPAGSEVEVTEVEGGEAMEVEVTAAVGGEATEGEDTVEGVMEEGAIIEYSERTRLVFS